jgi:hypothetical protein
VTRASAITLMTTPQEDGTAAEPCRAAYEKTAHRPKICKYSSTVTGNKISKLRVSSPAPTPGKVQESKRPSQASSLLDGQVEVRSVHLQTDLQLLQVGRTMSGLLNQDAFVLVGLDSHAFRDQ